MQRLTSHVRLGLRLVSKLSVNGANRLLDARINGPFTSAADLVRRTGINQGDQQALAIAGALENISGDRHQAQWDLLGVEALPELLADASANEPALPLPTPTDGENTVADYMSLGLTLNQHPLALLREKLNKKRILDSGRWASVPHGRMARIAGIIKVRQRPGSANGVIFLTIEDEGGPMNVIVWNQVVEQFRKEVLSARMVSVYGLTQREQGVVHLHTLNAYPQRIPSTHTLIAYPQRIHSSTQTPNSPLRHTRHSNTRTSQPPKIPTATTSKAATCLKLNESRYTHSLTQKCRQTHDTGSLPRKQLSEKL